MNVLKSPAPCTSGKAGTFKLLLLLMGSSLSTPLSLQLFHPGVLISWATKQSLLLHLSHWLHNYYSYTPFSSALSMRFTLLLCMCCKHWVPEAYHHQLGVLVSTARTVSSYMYKNLYMRTSDSLLYIVIQHQFRNIYLYWVLSYYVGSMRLAYYIAVLSIFWFRNDVQHPLIVILAYRERDKKGGAGIARRPKMSSISGRDRLFTGSCLRTRGGDAFQHSIILILFKSASW